MHSSPAQAWKQHLYPVLESHLAHQVDTVSTYYLLYHEVTLANLLEVCMYHQHVCCSVEEDHLLELVDFCVRKLGYLTSDQGKKDKDASGAWG